MAGMKIIQVWRDNREWHARRLIICIVSRRFAISPVSSPLDFLEHGYVFAVERSCHTTTTCLIKRMAKRSLTAKRHPFTTMRFTSAIRGRLQNSKASIVAASTGPFNCAKNNDQSASLINIIKQQRIKRHTVVLRAKSAPEKISSLKKDKHFICSI